MQDVTVRLADTLLDEQLDGMQAAGGHYDKVIGNPPYGAWQDTRKRELLKKKYAGHMAVFGGKIIENRFLHKCYRRRWR